MIKTVAQVFSQTFIRLQMIFYQIDAVNRQTVNSQKLTAVLEYCIPHQYLERVTIHGMRGNESHATVEIRIDRVSNDVRVAFEGPPLPGPYAGGPAMVEGDALPPDLKDRSQCPVWRKAVDFFLRLCSQKGLDLWWTVVIREKRDEICRKFGLVPASFVDRTRGAAAHAISNSALPELTLTAAFSHELWPDEKGGI